MVRKQWKLTEAATVSECRGGGVGGRGMVRGRGFTINTRGAAPVASEGRRRDRWGPNREFDSLHIVYITACG